MIYKIDGNYYIKSDRKYVQLILTYTSDDVTIEPTDIILEDNGDIKAEELNFLNSKQRLLEEHKNSSKYSFDEKTSHKKYSK